MTDALWNLLFLLIALGILVTIHEAGHFFAARACGVKVLRFYIGFGRAVFKRKGKDGCEYGIAAIPLGGYVQMLGEMSDDGGNTYSREEFERLSFKHKSVWQRAFIIAAGPAANLALAFIIYTIIAMNGITTIKPVVGYVQPGSIASQAGFKQYDLIESIGGTQTDSWSDVVLSLVSHTGSIASVTLSTDIGSQAERETRLNLESVTAGRKNDIFEQLGFSPCFGRENNIIAHVADNSPAFKAGIRKGDELVSVEGESIVAFYQFKKLINTINREKLVFMVRRDGELYETTVIPSRQIPQDGSVGRDSRVYVGVGFERIPIDGLYSKKEYGFFEALAYSASSTYQVSTFIVKSIAMLIAGAVSPESISGPIGIAQEAGSSAKYGILSFLGFLAVISVNLGIFNLLPVPVLDGGQLMFIAYEAVTKRAPGERIRYLLTMIGLGILVALTVFAVFNDIQSLL